MKESLKIFLSDVKFNDQVFLRFLISLTYINFQVLMVYILEFCSKQEM